MSKKYKHKPTYENEHSALRATNTKLINENQVLRTENERLGVALRLLTSEDKQTLLDAVKSLEAPSITFDNTWYSGTTSHIYGATGTTGSLGAFAIIAEDPNK